MEELDFSPRQEGASSAIIRPKIGDLKPDEVGWEPSKEELVEIYGGQQHKKRLREVKVGQLREMKEAISASKKKVEALFDIVEVSAERLVQGLISSSIDIDDSIIALLIEFGARNVDGQTLEQ
ncbi:hypothetical protein CIB48_g9259 [Xylaria polymorpha]|nr:hypothetical protein CIB48_g9259 [Xylaria polymorpha]